MLVIVFVVYNVVIVVSGFSVMVVVGAAKMVEIPVSMIVESLPERDISVVIW